MKKINKLLIMLPIFCLVSCNNQNNIKEYDLSTDENRVLVKDFTLYDAVDCARYIRKCRYSTSCFFIDIFHYFEKSVYTIDNYNAGTGYIITARELDPLDRMGEYLTLGVPYEEINGKEYYWNKKNDQSYSLIPILVTFQNIYTLSEAYNLNYINDKTLSNVTDLYFNHLEDCKVNIRFKSYNSL